VLVMIPLSTTRLLPKHASVNTIVIINYPVLRICYLFIKTEGACLWWKPV
jgi:hypothetical protein